MIADKTKFESHTLTKIDSGEGTGGVIFRSQDGIVVKKFRMPFSDHTLCELITNAMIVSDQVLHHKEISWYYGDDKKIHVAACLDYGLPLLSCGIPQLYDSSVKRLFYDCLLGAQDIVDQGYLHRDHKPENVVVVKGRAKIIDFGLCKKVKNVPVYDAAYTQYLRAPEVELKFENQGPASEAFAMGVTFAATYIGNQTLMYSTPSPYYHKYPQCLDSLMVKNNVPDVLRDLITKMTNPDPIKRLSILDAMSHPYFDYLPDKEVWSSSKSPRRLTVCNKTKRYPWLIERIKNYVKGHCRETHFAVVYAATFAIYDHFAVLSDTVNESNAADYIDASFYIADIIRGYGDIGFHYFIPFSENPTNAQYIINKRKKEATRLALVEILQKLNYRVDFFNAYDAYCLHHQRSPSKEIVEDFMKSV